MPTPVVVDMRLTSFWNERWSLRRRCQMLPGHHRGVRAVALSRYGVWLASARQEKNPAASQLPRNSQQGPFLASHSPGSGDEAHEPVKNARHCLT
jgi:hypothetical protein